MAGKSNLDPSKVYLVRGSTLAQMQRRDDALWAGDNIQRGPGIYRRGSGSAGFTLSTIPGGQGTPPASTILHPLWVYDVSTGSTPKVSVTPGTVNAVVPTIGGNPINVQIGTPLAYPALTVGSSDTVLYAQSTIDPTTGIFNVGAGVAILSATTMPASTATTWNMFISTFAVTISGGKASVQCNNDGVGGSQIFQFCGILPVTDDAAAGGAYYPQPI